MPRCLYSYDMKKNDWKSENPFSLFLWYTKKTTSSFIFEGEWYSTVYMFLLFFVKIVVVMENRQ